MTVTRRSDGAPDEVVLGPGEATINPAGVWHVVDMDGPTRILSVTAAFGTEHHPRTEPARP